MKKNILLLMTFLITAFISAIGQSTNSKDQAVTKSATINIVKPALNENLELNKISEIQATLRKLENENRQLKLQIGELEKKFQTHTHKVGGFIGTGFQVTDKLSPGTMVAIPFAASGEEMQRNKKTSYPINE